MRAGLQTAFARGFTVPDEFVADMRATSWDAFVGATTALDDYLAERDLGARVASLSVPVTVVFGEQDVRVDPASLRVFTDADIVRIPEAATRRSGRRRSRWSASSQNAGLATV